MAFNTKMIYITLDLVIFGLHLFLGNANIMGCNQAEMDDFIMVEATKQGNICAITWYNSHGRFETQTSIYNEQELGRRHGGFWQKDLTCFMGCIYQTLIGLCMYVCM